MPLHVGEDVATTQEVILGTFLEFTAGAPSGPANGSPAVSGLAGAVLVTMGGGLWTPVKRIAQAFRGFCGGGDIGAARQTTVDRHLYKTETAAASASAALSTGRDVMGSLTSGSRLGYFTGGETTASPAAPVTEIDSTTLAVDTTALDSATLPVAVKTHDGSRVTEAVGVLFGGIDVGVIRKLIQRVAFATTTFHGTSATLVTERRRLSSCTDYSGRCWAVAGDTNIGGTNSVERYTEANATATVVAGAALPAAFTDHRTVCSFEEAYSAYDAGIAAAIYKTVFATETSAASTATAGLPRRRTSGHEAPEAGYWSGGVDGAGSTGYSRTDKIDFATETSSQVAGMALSSARGFGAGFGM